MEKQIHIKDKKNNTNKWIIEEEKEKTYKIFSNGYTTEIYKDSVFFADGKLCSTVILNNQYEDTSFGDKVICDNCIHKWVCQYSQGKACEFWDNGDDLFIEKEYVYD